MRAFFTSAHDWLSRASFSVACLFVAAIACSLFYEVVARYFFGSPSEWASPLVSYSLLAAIFLAMPELTRQSAHIAISLLLETSGAAFSAALARFIRLAAGITCLVAAWFSADATLSQFAIGIGTGPPLSIPKWILSAVIPYGMLSSGLYFLRQLLADTPPTVSIGDEL